MTKNELRQYRIQKLEIEQIKEQLTRIRSEISTPKIQIITGMPGGGHTNAGLEGKIAKLVSLEEAYTQKLTELTEKQISVERCIEQLDTIERVLMRSRYIDGNKWEAVCIEIGYSWQQTHRMHARILNKICNTN